MGSKNRPKKFQAPIHPEDPFSVGAPMPKHGQIRPKVNFDRKVVKTQFFYEHDQNAILKIFP